jgi:hypothetical protein
MNYLLLIILTTSVIGIGALSLYFKDFIERFSYPITIISSSMVCGLIFIHIFPEVFEIGGHKIGLAILGGLFLQMILDRLYHNPIYQLFVNIVLIQVYQTVYTVIILDFQIKF